MLSPSAVKQFYDRFGARQDRQGFYEDDALDDLFEHADFTEARSIVEFGCGTGRFAERILSRAPATTYAGFDVSSTMIGLARNRLGSFGPRAEVRQLEPGTVRLPLEDRAADRVVSTYVLDLLSDDDIRTFFQEARRVLQPAGRLCLASLTGGTSLAPRIVGGLWELAFRIRPQLVGGCRPIHLLSYCQTSSWEVLHHRTTVQWAISSEVLIARRL